MERYDILFLVRSLNVGGAERQLMLLAKALHLKGMHIAVAQFYGGGVFADELQSAGVPLFDLRKGGRWSNLRFLWRLWKLIRQLQPRITHGYLSSANLILLLLKPFLKVQGVAVVCGVRASDVDLSMYDRVTAYLEIFHRWALRFSDAVICNSWAGLEYVSRNLADNSRFHLVDNGIDCDKFSYKESGRRNMRAQWAATDDMPLVGLVGRHDPVKGHDLFLSAAAMVANQIPDARFVVVGSEVATVTPNLKKQAKALGISARVIWAGYQSDPSAVYSALDVLCLCSQSEGFPNVVAEAMSCGLPSVCTDVGDVRRLVEDEGWIIKGREANDLATALLHAIRALPEWDRKRPRRRIIKLFGIDMLADRTLAVLAPLLK